MMARFSFDPGASRFTVQAFAAGMLSGLGHNPTFTIRDFKGELSFPHESPANASIQLTVTAGSLTLIDSVKPKDREEIESRMRQEVLETSSYPKIVFQSTTITADKI